jgi:transposase
MTFPRNFVFQGCRNIDVNLGRGKMKKIPKQEYTAEFKELAVKRVKAGQTVGAAAKELGLIEQTLRNWVKAAAVGKLNGAGARIVTPEEMEFSRLRAENIRLQRENEILIPKGHKKKRRHIYALQGALQGMHCEVCRDRHPAPVLRLVRNVPGAVRQRLWLPSLETRWQALPETPERRPDAGIDPSHPC